MPPLWGDVDLLRKFLLAATAWGGFFGTAIPCVSISSGEGLSAGTQFPNGRFFASPTLRGNCVGIASTLSNTTNRRSFCGSGAG